MLEEPVDISEYVVEMDAEKGINLYEEAEVTNLSIPTEQLLELIHLR